MSRSRLRRITRPLRHKALSLLLHFLTWVAARTPLLWCQRGGVLFGLLIRSLSPRLRGRIVDQLQVVQASLPHLTNRGDTLRALKDMERAHWRDLGRRVGEWLAGERALNLFWATTDTLETLDHAYRLAQQGRGLIVCTAHYGHWELMASWLSQRGYSFLAVASASPRGPFGSWLTRHRARHGVTVIHPQGGARAARRHLQTGGVVALLIDHSTAERSSLYPFLGQLAPHSLTADRLAHSSGSPVLWVSNLRRGDGRYEVIARPISPDLRESESRAVITLKAHQYLAEQVSESPEQWLWLHQRWTPRAQQDELS